jgi:hypothetical protein
VDKDVFGAGPVRMSGKGPDDMSYGLFGERFGLPRRP